MLLKLKFNNNELIKKPGSVLEAAVETLEMTVQRRILHKVNKIMDNP